MDNFWNHKILVLYQILIQSDGNTKVYNEYDDYGDYKTAYDHVQLQIIEKNQILFSLKKEPYYSKVAWYFQYKKYRKKQQKGKVA